MNLDSGGRKHYGARDFFRHLSLKKRRFQAYLHGLDDTMVDNGKKPPSTPSPAQPEKSFETRLDEARRAGNKGRRSGLNETNAFGIATRLTAELVSGLVVGGGAGWLLDRLFGTSPWLLVVFFMFGAGAGIANVFRAARQMNAANTDEKDDQTK
ncbi:AtpZ/AtpI family protein [Govanella unica]|uniref:AtpZ/AtpI family protein n=1 Tax=Govanella unica TaxID=2975056 RepID=A0A9X3TXE8_9PROT|nr:AtpZ/AtpI family protein [Govania unica]MDA5193374.1 AtpZ/AtpI family protein [Govania unica]